MRTPPRLAGGAATSMRSRPTKRRRRASARARCCRCGTGSAGASRCGRRSASPRCCAIGADTFEEFLAGAQRHRPALRARRRSSRTCPVLMALIGVWNMNFLGARDATACCPTRNALRLLPAYLQQLEMESNGKRVDREGRAVDYATAPVLWGARRHGQPALLPPAPAPGHAGRAGRLHRRSASSAELVGQRRTRRPMRSPSAPTTPTLPPHRRHPGNRPSSMLLPGQARRPQPRAAARRSTSTRCSRRA